MAITINQEPDKFSPAFNDLIYVVTSTNVAQTNFKYVIDIYLSSDTVNKIARIKMLPGPTNKAVIDVKRIIQDHVSYDNFGSGFFTCGNSYEGYLVKFGEEYGSTPVVYADLTTSNTRYAFNAAFSSQDFLGYLSATYLLQNASTIGALTNAGTSATVHILDNHFLYFLTDTANCIKQAVIKVYSSGGVGTYTDTNSFTAMTDPNRLIGYACGPANINAQHPGAIDANTTYYTIEIQNSSNSTRTPVYTFTMSDFCSKYTLYRLHFLNALGGFDAFNFNLVSRAKRTIERKNYKKYLGALSGSAWAYNVYDRGTVQYDTKVGQTLKLNSNWITEAQATWLEELLTSPQVFLETATGLLLARTFLPAIVTNAEYEVKKKENDKLFNIEIDLQLIDKIRQRG